jgi:hypothetical protein
MDNTNKACKTAEQCRRRPKPFPHLRSFSNVQLSGKEAFSFHHRRDALFSKNVRSAQLRMISLSARKAYGLLLKPTKNDEGM